MTVHGAKGMAFTHVILMGVGKEFMPLRFRLKNLSEQDARAALQQERSLLYVAASRARDALVITTVGERSELLPEQRITSSVGSQDNNRKQPTYNTN